MQEPDVLVLSLQAGDIDVLFFGKLNAYRRERLHHLRAAGIRVFHANAPGRPIFGRDLHVLIQSTKVVLSLRYFDHDTEWKMTRWLGPIANGVVVIAERSGHPKEQAEWEGAVIFAEPSELIHTVRFYLTNKRARQRAATSAQGLLQSIPEVEVLAPHISAVASRQCPK